MALLLLLNFFSPSHQLSQIKYTLLTHQPLGDGALRSRNRGEGGGNATRIVVRRLIPTQKWFLGLHTTLYTCPGGESCQRTSASPPVPRRATSNFFFAYYIHFEVEILHCMNILPGSQKSEIRENELWVLPPQTLYQEIDLE